MRKVLLTFAIVFTIATASTAFAQTPYFQLYFDEGMQEASADCPGVGVVDTLYIVAHNFDMWIGAAEFQVDYTTHLTWLGEVAVGTDLVIGSSPTGVAISWPTPRQGFNAVDMMHVTVMWNCDNCTGIGGTPGSEIIISEWPGKNAPRAVDWQTDVAVDGVGMTSLICAQVPVEETSWGQIKSLYH
jgi:hypothetical protein